MSEERLLQYAGHISDLLDELTDEERREVIAEATQDFCINRTGCYRRLRNGEERCYCERDD